MSEKGRLNERRKKRRVVERACYRFFLTSLEHENNLAQQIGSEIVKPSPSNRRENFYFFLPSHALSSHWPVRLSLPLLPERLTFPPNAHNLKPWSPPLVPSSSSSDPDLDSPALPPSPGKLYTTPSPSPALSSLELNNLTGYVLSSLSQSWPPLLLPLSPPRCWNRANHCLRWRSHGSWNRSDRCYCWKEGALSRSSISRRTTSFLCSFPSLPPLSFSFFYPLSYSLMLSRSSSVTSKNPPSKTVSPSSRNRSLESLTNDQSSPPTRKPRLGSTVS